MDEEQRARQAQAHMEEEAEQASGLPEAVPEARPPSPDGSRADAAGRPPRPAWFTVALVLALPLLGFFVARLAGLLVGAVVGVIVVAALRLARRP